MRDEMVVGKMLTKGYPCLAPRLDQMTSLPAHQTFLCFLLEKSSNVETSGQVNAQFITTYNINIFQ